MRISQRELFKATVSHTKESGILFYADFAGVSDINVRNHFGISSQESIREALGMLCNLWR